MEEEIPLAFLREIPEDLLEEVGKTASHHLSTHPEAESIIERASQKESIKHKLKVGDKVKHTQFGEGIVLQIEPMEDDAIVTVFFTGLGSKRLSLNFANLQKI
jgi:DNA helicase-2/ATP-dependent DNA helicase PcrA